MKLTNDFVVEAPLAKVWELFDQLDRIVPCMPGATYLGPVSGEHRVSMKVKIGAVVANFQGTVGIVEKDETAQRVVMRGAARDTGGKGTASSLIECQLTSLTSAQTRVEVATQLSMTGRFAQFGGPIVADIAQRLIREFSANLHKEVLAAAAAPAGADVAPVAAEAKSPPVEDAATTQVLPAMREVQPLDLGAIIGASMWERVRRPLLPFALGCVAGWYAARFW